jgi:hypothetical protein
MKKYVVIDTRKTRYAPFYKSPFISRAIRGIYFEEIYPATVFESDTYEEALNEAKRLNAEAKRPPLAEQARD